jgi:uncharacterized protein involved in exopolysaccharide biosynthesis
MSDLADYAPDLPRSEIVQWFNAPTWRNRAVPTPVAFGLGLLLGACAALFAAHLLDD